MGYSLVNKQDDNLTGAAASIDVSTEKNMQDLVKIAQEMLRKPTSRVDPETGRLQEIPQLGTNAAALRRFVLLISALTNCQRVTVYVTHKKINVLQSITFSY